MSTKVGNSALFLLFVTFTSFCGPANADVGRRTVCGLVQPTLRERIAECERLNGDDAKKIVRADIAYAPISTWVLVSVNRSNQEIWMNSDTGIIWSGVLGQAQYCEAAGFEPSHCDEQLERVRSLAPVSMCEEIPGFSSDGFDEAKAGMRLQPKAHAPGVKWLLPDGNHWWKEGQYRRILDVIEQTEEIIPYWVFQSAGSGPANYRGAYRRSEVGSDYGWITRYRLDQELSVRCAGFRNPSPRVNVESAPERIVIEANQEELVLKINVADFGFHQVLAQIWSGDMGTEFTKAISANELSSDLNGTLKLSVRGLPSGRYVLVLTAGPYTPITWMRVPMELTRTTIEVIKR